MSEVQGAAVRAAAAKAIRAVRFDGVSLKAALPPALADLRDPRELEREGRIPGAVHCPRGMLEFWIDPESPYHKPVFAQDKTYLFFCAAGWRSALSAATAQDMGLQPVAHMEGGFTAWKNAGGAVETVEPKKA